MSMSSSATTQSEFAFPAPSIPDRNRPLDSDTVAFRVLGDLRLIFVLAPGLIMQTMHPVVNAGVDQYSIYAAKPWERLIGSLMPIIGAVYDGPDAAELGQRIRAAHRNIKGVDDRGRTFHAMDPDAYMWVWATIFDNAVRMEDLFGKPLSEVQRREFYHEWRYVGIGLGLHPGQMPPDLDAFYEHYDQKARDRLEIGCVPTNVFSIIDNAPPPPGWPLGGAAWRSAWLPLRRIVLGSTKAALPESVRKQLGMSWTASDAVEMAVYGAVIRAVFAVLPERARYFPRAYRGIQHSRGKARGRNGESMTVVPSAL